MKILTHELPKCLNWKNTSFGNLFYIHKLDVVTDVIQKEILPHKLLVNLFDKWSDKISKDDLERALLSPKFWKLVVSGRQDADYYNKIEKLILNELLFIDASTREHTVKKDLSSNSELIHAEIIWNLRGDFAFEQNQNILYANTFNCCQSNILLDFFSDMVRGVQRDIPWGDTGFSESQIEDSEFKISQALLYIEKVSKPCFDVLKNSIQTIAIRFDASKNSFNCASTNYCNGLIILINPDLNSVTVEALADAIVHEMTHNLFDVSELYEPCVPTKYHPRVIKSPWTGRMLDPNTYIQACYTWFGLKNFWSQANDLLGSEQSRDYLKQSLKGFGDIQHLEAIKNSDFHFEDKIINTLESLQ